MDVVWYAFLSQLVNNPDSQFRLIPDSRIRYQNKSGGFQNEIPAFSILPATWSAIDN
jgi:hypothetical protein